MSQNILFNGLTYTIPDTGETDWGENLTDYFVAIPQGALQKTGGVFTLTADVNFGPNFGIIVAYLKSIGVALATVGFIRLTKDDVIAWRNNADDGNLELSIDANDDLVFNGEPLNAQMAANTLKGNNTGSPAYPMDLTGTEVTAMLDDVVGDSGAGGVKGLVPAPAAGDGAAEKFLKADGTWETPAGAGTVTSVGLVMPAEFSVANSPITSAGDLTVTKANQNSNLIYAGPLSGSAAAPTFRSIGSADFGVGAVSAFTLNNLGLAASVSSNALTIALKINDGSTDPTADSPVTIGFRSATSANGNFNLRSVTSALSLVISQGSTLGTTSGVPAYLWVYALDNAGTVELAVSQTRFDEGSIVSTTAEGGAGAADSNRVIYSTTSRSNVPIRIIGRLLVTQTSTNWNAAPTEITLGSALWLPGSINCKYTQTSGQSIPSSTFTIMTGLTKVYDTCSMMNPTTGAATAPFAGKYRISGGCGFDGVLGAGAYIGASAAKNGSLNTGLNYLFNAGAFGRPGGSTTIECAAGDTLAVMAYQETGSPQNTSGSAVFNWIAIEWLGV